MTRYSRGRDAEYKYRDIMEEKGYLVVRSAASKKVADLIAVNETETVLIQIKRSKGILYKNQIKEEVAIFDSMKMHPNLRLLIMGWSDKMRCFVKMYERTA